MKNKSPCIYILASKVNGVLYIGVTSDLIGRIWQHKEHQSNGFTDKYHVTMLVYFEQYDDMNNAITREKQLKKWNRDWKVKLIEKNNPDWLDLYSSIT